MDESNTIPPPSVDNEM